MRVVLDTNVVISGIFFSGPPYTIINAWREGKIQIILTAEIFAEYQRVAGLFAVSYPGINVAKFMNLVLTHAEFVEKTDLPEQVCADPDDDKFIACALSGKVVYIISGDHHLLDRCGYKGLKIIKPRQFVTEYLKAN